LTNNPVAAFDSGVGSLSIIRELKKEIPHEDLLYFADRYHFPYGNKSHQQLYEIILASIKFLENYKPKVIVVASITPSVQILHKVRTRVSCQIIGVMPPLRTAARLSKKKHIGIMATEGTIFSQELSALLRREVAQDVRVTRFNASPIIELIDNGIYISNERKTFDTISHLLMGKLEKEDIDVIILGSTHLSFVQNYLNSLFPRVKFVDPSRIVAKDVKKFLLHNRMLRRSGVGRLQLITSGDRNDHFDQTIRLMGFREAIKRVNP
jgi:glutamate racemase